MYYIRIVFKVGLLDYSDQYLYKYYIYYVGGGDCNRILIVDTDIDIDI